METEPKPGASEKLAWFLLAGLGVFIFIIVLLLINYRPFQPAYLLTPTRRTQTEAPTQPSVPSPTSTRTPRPTWTLRPLDTPTTTLTPTVTPESTRLMLPTLTPALPYKFNFRYDLSTPAPETADRITHLMRQLPGLLYDTFEERLSSNYHQAFRYAVFAYQEALLRYPQASQSTDWRWGLAFSLAHTGHPAASVAYADLIFQGHYEKNYPVAALPKWFHSHEPELTLTVHPLDESSGLHLLEIQPGEMYLLLQSTAGKVQIFPLFDSFIFDTEIQTAFYYGDLTGDGTGELAIYRQAPGDTRLHDLAIFDLSDGSLKRLPVIENQPLDIRMSFAINLSCSECSVGQAPSSRKPTLQMEAVVFPACPVTAVRSYQWDGSQFLSQPLVYSARPVKESLAYCETILTHAADFLPSPANVALMTALQPVWPPALDLGGSLYPKDSQAALAYKLGIFQALAGDPAGATQTLQSVANLGVATWSEAAASFLSQYNNGLGLYQSCQSAQYCSPERALQQVLITHAPGDLDSALRLLWQSGLSTAANGKFDFNRDGKLEGWFTLRTQSTQALEFWIMVVTQEGVQAVFVDFVEESKPPIYFSIAYPADSVFQFEPKHGYALRLTKERQEPYIDMMVVEPVLTTYTRDQLAEAEVSLFSGTPADTIRRKLEDVLQSGRFNCLNGRICDRFYYTLGLAYELSGQERDAIDTYIKLWWENKNSPFTTMARSKLVFNPPITPGPSPTPLVTITRTPTPGPSPTGGPTPTEEPYPYPEPTQPTITPGAYP